MIYIMKMKLLVLVFCVPILSGCYILRQGYVQSARLLSARPLHEVMNDPKVEKNVKEKLAFIEKVKEYARSQHLSVDENYSSYIDLGSEARISYLVSAAPRFEIKLKTWNYVFAGKFPYLGFFSKSDRDDYADFLSQKMKMDIYRGEAAAFSFLGWIDDPIYSTMLNEDNEDIAATLFHELTHSTIWIKNDVEFNESIAEYVSEVLLDAFDQLNASQRQKNRLLQKADRIAVATWVSSLKAELEEYYRSSRNVTEGKRLEVKESIFAQGGKRFPKVNTPSLQSLNSRPWNNARLLAISLYTPDFSELEESFSCRDSIKVGDWLNQIKRLHLENDLAFSLKNACHESEHHVRNKRNQPHY